LRFLVVYGTSEGHTAKIATYAATRLAGRGDEAMSIGAANLPADFDPTGFDAFVVASRVHAGAFHPAIVRFVGDYLPSIRTKPSAFISVSIVAARNDPKAVAELAGYMARFTRKTGWTPSFLHHAAGARLYSRHNAFGRWILKLIDERWIPGELAAVGAGPGIDTSRDYEFTDWSELGRFADAFAEAVRQKAAAATPAA